MSERSVNWKKRLLRSSVPLEHEVAAVLTARGFHVSADYAYNRLDGPIEREFSIDVRGVKGAGPLEMAGRQAVLDVLVECKYRDRGATWLFLPTPNYGTMSFGDAVQSLDVFSPKFIHDVTEIDPSVPSCYSAVEVGSGESATGDDSGKGRAIESQLKHGLRQLQYAIPPLVAMRAKWLAFRKPADNFPFSFAPILVTNAALMVAPPTFSVASVEAAESLSDLGTSVPYVVWEAGVGPDFYAHFQRHFRDLAALGAGCFKEVETIRKTARAWNLPSGLLAQIAVDGSTADEIAEFGRVIVANIAALPEIIELVSHVFLRRAASLKDEPLLKR